VDSETAEVVPRDIPELKLPKETLDLATQTVNTKFGHFDPSLFQDRYEKRRSWRLASPKEMNGFQMSLSSRHFVFGSTMG
jgi:non-homologous end joining protein Ku